MATVPAGLEADGRRLWRAVLADFELNAAELAVLESLCRAKDRGAKIARLIEKSSALLVSGSTGQVRPSPLFEMANSNDRVIVKLVGQLDLPQKEQASELAREQWRQLHRRVGSG